MAGSQWVRLDTGYFRNPKVLRAGHDAALLHLAAIFYLGEHESRDGLVPPEAIKMLAASVKVARPDDTARTLVKHCLWHVTETGDFLVHDWDTTNGEHSPAAEARKRQAKRRAELAAAQNGTVTA